MTVRVGREGVEEVGHHGRSQLPVLHHGITKKTHPPPLIPLFVVWWIKMNRAEVDEGPHRSGGSGRPMEWGWSGGTRRALGGMRVRNPPRGRAQGGRIMCATPLVGEGRESSYMSMLKGEKQDHRLLQILWDVLKVSGICTKANAMKRSKMRKKICRKNIHLTKKANVCDLGWSYFCNENPKWKLP